MSHFGDYMDGVPVKISEKYKRPPRIELPRSVYECPSRGQHVVDNIKYCFKFENNVLSKIQELRNAKETKKNERRHRLQLLEEAKQKKLDAIAAAEAEEKLKLLSVSEVSYPSTEEISEISPDDKAVNCDITLTQDQDQAILQNAHGELEQPSLNNQAEVDPNMLQPIQVQSNYTQNNLLDDLDPLQEYKNKSVKIPQYKSAYKHNIETMTFKDFENDTSSPFDNVELKTINDMELLAQVLQSQRESTISCVQQPSMDQNYVSVPNCASQGQMTYMPSSYEEQPITGSGGMYSSQPYTMNNGTYLPVDSNNCDNILQMDNTYMQNYQYYIPPNPYNLNNTYYQQPEPLPKDTAEYNIVNDSSYIPTPQYYGYQAPYQYQQPTYSTEVPMTISDSTYTASGSQSTIKSRSRSVPDIVKELDAEVSSARLRASERSYNPSPAPKKVPCHSQFSSNKNKDSKRSKRKGDKLPNPFDKLSPLLQDTCRKIHGMGFPLDRVARVCTLVGESDKKIIEGLLMMSELMDLGFHEGCVSAALAKHDFDKDKALEELVP